MAIPQKSINSSVAPTKLETLSGLDAQASRGQVSQPTSLARSMKDCNNIPKSDH